MHDHDHDSDEHPTFDPGHGYRDEPTPDPNQQPPSPEQDAAIARMEAKTGNLQHALFHIACALAADPMRQEWRDLMDEIIAAAPDPLALVPMDEKQTYFAVAAARAVVQFKLKAFDEALGLLMQVVAVKPDAGFGAWAAEWLADSAVARAIEPAVVTQPLWRWLETFPGGILPDATDREMVAQVLPVLARIREAHPEHVAGWTLGAAMLRKTGELDAALACAVKAYDLQPTWMTAVARAEVHRAKGDVDPAISAYEDAISHDATDISARLDLGDMLADVGRFAEAEKWYREVLDREPAHEWAIPSMMATQAMVTDVPAERDAKLAELDAYAEAHPENRRAANLSRLFYERRTPYLGFLPEPQDATVNALRQITAEVEADGNAWDESSTVQIRLSSLEAPSVRLAFAAEMKRLGRHLTLAITTEKIPEPDPRVPSGPAEYVLWEYDGDVPRQAVEPPTNADVVDVVADLASYRFNAADWAHVAGQIGADLGREALPSILGAMVHPPDPPDWMPGWMWVQRVQIVAAMLIAGIDEGWQGSLRQQVLTSLVRGPMDWTVDAAIIALVQLARADDSIAQDVLDLLCEVVAKVPTTGHVCYLYPLVCNALLLPDLPPEIREPFAKMKADLEADPEAEDDGEAEAADGAGEKN